MIGPSSMPTAGGMTKSTIDMYVADALNVFIASCTTGCADRSRMENAKSPRRSQKNSVTRPEIE
jgi:hypothetical protein